MSIAGILVALMAGAGPAPSTAAPPPVEDIVVTGTRGSGVRKVRPDAVEILRDHCFEPMRLTRGFAIPSPGPRWIELDDKERRQFQIEDPDVPAYAMEDESRTQHLWLKFERLEHKSNTLEQRCTLLVIGGHDHGRFVDDMSALFNGRGTQRHVGQRDGMPALAGWEQWVWTGMPARNSKSWKTLDPQRRLEPGWLRVIDVPTFYNSHDYILGDMKSRTGQGTAVTMLSFSYTTRPRRQTASSPAPSAGASLSSAGIASPR